MAASKATSAPAHGPQPEPVNTSASTIRSLRFSVGWYASLWIGLGKRLRYSVSSTASRACRMALWPATRAGEHFGQHHTVAALLGGLVRLPVDRVGKALAVLRVQHGFQGVQDGVVARNPSR